MKELDKFPMDVVMNLYRQKISAEKKNDRTTLTKLENQYPDLFSPEFEDFIFDLRMIIDYMQHKHGVDFKKMFEAEDFICH